MRIIYALIVLLLTGSYAVAADTWTPIIGIPAPPFGITTSHTMYADCDTYKYDYGEGDVCYKIGPNGPYTHYIDPDDPNSTDSANPYGTVAVPRKSRPNELSGNPVYTAAPVVPGSVVEMHSGLQGNVGSLDISGTATLPIFIRGIEGDEPTFVVLGTLHGSYIVVENIKFDMKQGNNTTISAFGQEGPQTHIAIRNCEFYNGQDDPSESYQVLRFKNSNDNSDLVQNIVVYENHFHNIGDSRTTSVKMDAVSVSIDSNVKYAWIIENTFEWLGGDGIQLAWDKFATSTDMPQYIYIGKNTAHDCYENFLDLKMCEDVIVSENTAYNFGNGYTAIGGETAIPFRYGLGEGPDDVARNNIWTLFNTAYNYNSPDGGFSSFTGTGEMLADEIYYIGNIVFNSHNTEGTSTGFYSSGQKKVYWINNTAYNTDRAGFFIGDAVGNAQTEKLTLVNNIFGEISSGSTVPYSLMFGAVQDSLDRMEFGSNIFYNSGGDAQFRVGIYNPPASASWTTYSTYSAFCTAYSSLCTDSTEDNPDHVDAANADFRLTADSPAVDAGALHAAYATFFSLYGISIQVDLAKTSIPAGIAQDIGAYEFIQPLRHFKLGGYLIKDVQ